MIWTDKKIKEFARENNLSTIYHLKTDTADAIAYKVEYRGSMEYRIALGSRVAPDKNHFASYDSYPQFMRTPSTIPEYQLIKRNKVINRFAFDKLSDAARAILCDLSVNGRVWKRITFPPPALD